MLLGSPHSGEKLCLHRRPASQEATVQWQNVPNEQLGRPATILSQDAERAQLGQRTLQMGILDERRNRYKWGLPVTPNLAALYLVLKGRTGGTGVDRGQPMRHRYKNTMANYVWSTMKLPCRLTTAR